MITKTLTLYIAINTLCCIHSFAESNAQRAWASYKKYKIDWQASALCGLNWP